MLLTLLTLLTLPAARGESGVHAEAAGAPALRVAPDRLQFFEYETVAFTCEGSGAGGEWRVMRRLRGTDTICGASWEASGGRCHVPQLFWFDSGTYWCQADGERRSDSLNVTVTAGPVILESPAHPVAVGGDVVLRCRSNANSSDAAADFYRDGCLLGTGRGGRLRIRRVSPSHRGRYRCEVAGSGESAESQLAVADLAPPCSDLAPPAGRGDQHAFLLRFPLIVIGLLLLLALAANVCVFTRARKLQAPTATYENIRPPATQPSSAEAMYYAIGAVGGAGVLTAGSCSAQEGPTSTPTPDM